MLPSSGDVLMSQTAFTTVFMGKTPILCRSGAALTLIGLRVKSILVKGEVSFWYGVLRACPERLNSHNFLILTVLLNKEILDLPQEQAFRNARVGNVHIRGLLTLAYLVLLMKLHENRCWEPL